MYWSLPRYDERTATVAAAGIQLPLLVAGAEESLGRDELARPRRVIPPHTLLEKNSHWEILQFREFFTVLSRRGSVTISSCSARGPLFHWRPQPVSVASLPTLTSSYPGASTMTRSGRQMGIRLTDERTCQSFNRSEARPTWGCRWRACLSSEDWCRSHTGSAWSPHGWWSCPHT